MKLCEHIKSEVENGYCFGWCDPKINFVTEDGNCKFYYIGIVPVPVGHHLKYAMRIGRKIILNTDKTAGIMIRKLSDKELARRLK